jgi:hypothetical protein
MKFFLNMKKKGSLNLTSLQEINKTCLASNKTNTSFLVRLFVCFARMLVTTTLLMSYNNCPAGQERLQMSLNVLIQARTDGIGSTTYLKLASDEQRTHSGKGQVV